MLAAVFSKNEMIEFLSKRGYSKINIQVWNNAERGNDVEYDIIEGVIKNSDEFDLVTEVRHKYDAQRMFGIEVNFERELKKVLLAL